LIVTFVIDFSTSKKLTDLFFSVISPDINFSFVFKSFTEIIVSFRELNSGPGIANPSGAPDLIFKFKHILFAN
jgi:hypothetical protein